MAIVDAAATSFSPALLAEGSAQVLEEAEFAAALAAEFGVTFEHLQFLNRIPVLLLHPSLTESAQGYLRARALECYHTCDWIVACARGPESELRLDPVATVKALRELAGNMHRPVLVLMADASANKVQEQSLYELAGLTVAFVTEKPRGHEIVGHAELLPLRDPAPPKVLDDRGNRLYVVSEMAVAAESAWKSTLEHRHYEPPKEWKAFEEAVTGLGVTGYEWQKGTGLMQRLGPFLKREETPTFYAEEVFRWLSRKGADSVERLCKAPSFEALISREVAQRWQAERLQADDESDEAVLRHRCKVADELAESRLGRTTLWPHEGRWFALGDRADTLRERLRQLCPELELGAPLFASRLAELLRQDRSPWLPDPVWFSDFARNTAAECGVGVAEALRFFRNNTVLQRAERRYYHHCRNEDPAEVARFRASVRSLLDREFVLAEYETWIVFVLRAALRAPLLALGTTAHASVQYCVVNLGAGHLVRFLFRFYPLEMPSPLQVMTDFTGVTSGYSVTDFTGVISGYSARETHLDGGDVHLQIDRLPDVPLLEAGVPKATCRRQGENEAAERRHREQMESDDDD